MRKILVIVLAMMLLLVGCGSKGDSGSDKKTTEGPKVKPIGQEIDVNGYHFLVEKWVRVSDFDIRNDSMYPDSNGVGLSILLEDDTIPMLDNAMPAFYFDTTSGGKNESSKIKSWIVVAEPVTGLEGYSVRLTFIYTVVDGHDLPTELIFNNPVSGSESYFTLDSMETELNNLETFDVDVSSCSFDGFGSEIKIDKKYVLVSSDYGMSRIGSKMARSIYDDSIAKLKNDNVIPDSDGDLVFNQVTLEPEFADSAKGAELTGAWNASLSGVVLADHAFRDEEKDRKLSGYSSKFADSPKDWKYLIVYTSYDSKIEEEFYYGGVDRISVTTLVLIIDVEKTEVVHIEFIGADCPPAMNAQSIRGEFMRDEALEYIERLLAK